MVQTRSSRAPEPLEVLQTPPKRTRKAQLSSTEAQEIPHPPFALFVTADIPPTNTHRQYRDIGTQYDEADFEVKMTDPVPTTQSSSKRRHAEVDTESQEPYPKRRERQTPSRSKEHIFMFPRPDDDEDEHSMSAPPKTLAGSIRRNRHKRQTIKQSNRLGITPRRQLLKLDGDDPFGFKPFDPSELPARRDLQLTQSIEDRNSTLAETTKRTNSITDLVVRDDQRSPAPEPETPRRGLFGSLRNIGSATFGLARSAVHHFTPRREASTPPQTGDTTPEQPLQITQTPHDEEVQYPAIEPIQNHEPQESEYENRNDTPTKMKINAADEVIDEDTKKRRAFIEKFGRPDDRYHHLHTTPIDGDPNNFTYPLPQTTPKSSEPLTESQLRSRKRRARALGQNPDEALPSTAPLFGPNSHYARGTMNPMFAKVAKGEHPYFGTKRKLDDTDIQAEEPEPNSRTTKTFQPYVEDDAMETADDSEPNGEETSTPLFKKQRVTQTDTPRSALKKLEPNSLGRSTSKSVAFNANPVTGIRKISGVFGGYGRPGHYTGGIFSTPTDSKSPSDSVSDPGSASPTTKANTFANSGLHPGDRLSQNIKAAMPSQQKEKVVFQWTNPDDPNWRPTLGNPRPGTFRVPYDLDDEEMDDLDQQLRSDDEESHEVPEQPSTPKISHAELPKNTANSTNDRGAEDLEREKAQLEKARLAAEKYKPRSQSRLSNVAATRSRSPSPPAAKDTITAAASDAIPGIIVDDGQSPDSSVQTPEEPLEPPTWTQNPETGEYICSSSRYPDFLANDHDELVPSFCLRGSDDKYDNIVRGPDAMTEKERQEFYAKKYDGMFKFDAPQTYEEAGTGSKLIHDLIRKFESENPDAVKRAQENMKAEWDAHQKAIEDAQARGLTLVPVYPDRIGEDLMDDDDE